MIRLWACKCPVIFTTGFNSDRVSGSPQYGQFRRLPIGMIIEDMIRAVDAGLVSFIRTFLDDESARPNMSVMLKKGAANIAAYLATFGN